EKRDYLLDEHDHKVAVIGGNDEYRWGRHYDEISLDDTKVETIGGHRVLRVDVTTSSVDDGIAHDDGHEDDRQTDTTGTETICVLGDATTPTRCPLQDVPIHETTALNDKTTATTIVTITIDEDGNTTVRLVEGASDARIAALVGSHKLW